jgi:hypothetical protein
MWQTLSAHGVQCFDSVEQIDERKRQVSEALSDLCDEVARIAGDVGRSGIDRARALRAKPEAGGKSPYECLNQLVHYWYCCAAARHLGQNDYANIQVRPTGHDNVPTDNGDGQPIPERVFDIEARHPSFGRVVAEVFCVSPALWPEKMRKTRNSLKYESADARFIYYNLEVKHSYSPKMDRLAVFGVIAGTGDVRQVFARFDHQVPGVEASQGTSEGPT